jgi:hypothetical protein
MKKTVLTMLSLFISAIGFSQIDTISKNIYQKDGNLGIGISDPETKLRIEGNVSEGDNRAFIRLRNINTGNKATVSLTLESNDKNYGTAFGFTSDSYQAIPDFNKMGVISTNGKGFSIYSSSNYGSIRFYTNVNQNGIIERMRINAEGNIGIGTKKPSAKLQIADGDIFISDINKGIIMKSPNGNCWRGNLDNNGKLNFSKVSCPGEEIAVDPDPSIPSKRLIVYPNPSENIITVKVPMDQIEKPKYLIFNLNGQLMDNGRIIYNTQTIDISTLAAGIYLLTIYDNNGNLLASEKIVKE